MLKTGNRGFTLIEVMVAAAILAFGVVLVYEALLKTLDASGYYADYLKVCSWMDEKIWQAQEELTRSGAFTQEPSGEDVFNNRRFRWDLSYARLGDKSGLFRIDLRLGSRQGKRDEIFTRSAYALFSIKE